MVIIRQLLLAAALLGPPSAFAQEGPVHLVVQVDGDVLLKRPEWKATSPVQVGTTLRLGDLIEPRAQGKARILCTDLSLAWTGSGLSGVPCVAQDPVIRWNGVRVGAARALQAGYPILLFPRATDIADARPTVRWSPAPGVTAYKVTILGPDRFRWESDQIATDYVRYPLTAPALSTDVTYQAFVEGGGRSSAEEGAPAAGFRVASPQRLATLASREKIVQALGLKATPTRLATAQLNATERMLQRAIDQLQPANDLSGRELSLLGELAIRMQRLDLAEGAYRQAISKLAKEDTEGLAVAQKMLGRLIAFKQPMEAKQLLQDASARYATLGDEKETDGIARLLRQL